MARPRLHDFDPLTMLRAIGERFQGRRDALAAELAAVREEMPRVRGESGQRWGQLGIREWQIPQELAELEAGGIPYDLPAFTGRRLTGSARIAAQTVVRKLEADGLVELFGAHARAVRLTPAGWAKVGREGGSPSTGSNAQAAPTPQEDPANA